MLRLVADTFLVASGNIMAERLVRTIAADLHIRTDGRTLCGIAVPFATPTTIVERAGRYEETFRRGAFTKTIAERGDKVKLLVQHDREQLPIGRAVLLREDPAGLYAEFRVSETRVGDEVLALVRDGAIDGLSVGFRPITDQWTHGRTKVERVECALAEVSVTAWPAFVGAQITAVRTTPTLPVALARRRLDLLLIRSTQ